MGACESACCGPDTNMDTNDNKNIYIDSGIKTYVSKKQTTFSNIFILSSIAIEPGKSI